MSIQAFEYLELITEESKNTDEISDAIYKYVLHFLSSTNIDKTESEKVFKDLADNASSIKQRVFFLSVSIHMRYSIDLFNDLIDLIWDNRTEFSLETLNGGSQV